MIVDALGRGGQILILRKGGLREERGGFQVEHSEFLFFPTLFHQQRESVLPGAQARFDEFAPHFPAADRLRLEFFARVIDGRKLDSLAAVERLRGQHVWREAVIAERFDWGKEQNIHALAVRVFRLPQAVELAMQPGYGGCKSWVELEQDLAVDGAQPVLNESEFAEKLSRYQGALSAAGAVAGGAP